MDLNLEAGDRIMIKLPLEQEDDYRENVSVKMQKYMIFTMLGPNRTELMDLLVFSCGKIEISNSFTE
jgi:hypothetical protein